MTLKCIKYLGAGVNTGFTCRIISGLNVGMLMRSDSHAENRLEEDAVADPRMLV